MNEKEVAYHTGHCEGFVKGLAEGKKQSEQRAGAAIYHSLELKEEIVTYRTVILELKKQIENLQKKLKRRGGKL